MTRTGLLLLIVTLLTAVIVVACAPARAQARPMTWKDIVSNAARNGSLAEQNDLIRSQEYTSRAAYSGYMPQLSLYFTRSRVNQEYIGTDTKQIGNEFGGKATISLFDGFATTGAVQRERANLRAAEVQKTVTGVDVRYQLRVAYFRLLVGQAEVDLARKIADRRKVNLQMIRLKYDNGMEARWSVSQAEAQLEQELLTVEQDLTNLKRSRLDLGYLLNLPSADEIEVTPDDEALKPLAPNAIDDAVASHPDLRLLKAQTDAAQANIRVADSQFLPQVAAEFSKGRQILNQTEPLDTTKIALTVTLSIFQGGNSYYGSKSARATRDSFETRLAYESRNVRTRLVQAENDLSIQLKLIPAAQKILQAAQSRSKTVTEQYRVGQKSFLEWEQSEQNLIQAERGELNARRDALLARAEWERARGEAL